MGTGKSLNQPNKKYFERLIATIDMISASLAENFYQSRIKEMTRTFILLVALLCSTGFTQIADAQLYRLWYDDAHITAQADFAGGAWNYDSGELFASAQVQTNGPPIEYANGYTYGQFNDTSSLFAQHGQAKSVGNGDSAFRPHTSSVLQYEWQVGTSTLPHNVHMTGVIKVGKESTQTQMTKWATCVQGVGAHWIEVNYDKYTDPDRVHFRRWTQYGLAEDYWANLQTVNPISRKFEWSKHLTFEEAAWPYSTMGSYSSTDTKAGKDLVQIDHMITIDGTGL